MYYILSLKYGATSINFCYNHGMNKDLSRGYIEAREITRKHAKTFYFCSMFLGREKRLASYAVYAFLRMMDDTFDSGGSSGMEELLLWKTRLDLVYSDASFDMPALEALRKTVNDYRIPRLYFDEMVRGMELDMKRNRYGTFPELYDYCYCVAGVVGLIMSLIFGSSGEKALLCAEKMGVAMQLTNILRDIKEDFAMGRIYLPSDEMAAYGVSAEKLSGGIIDDNFRELMKFQIKRARTLYSESMDGVHLINDRAARRVAELMAEMYSGILVSIERSGYDVFSKRNFVSPASKFLMALKLIFPPLP